MSVWLFVCLFVAPVAYLNNHMSKFHQIFCKCYRWPWLGFPLKQCDMLRTFYFVDDVVFSHNGPINQMKRDVMFCPVHQIQTAAPVAKTAVSYCMPYSIKINSTFFSCHKESSDYSATAEAFFRTYHRIYFVCVVFDDILTHMFSTKNGSSHLIVLHQQLSYRSSLWCDRFRTRQRHRWHRFSLYVCLYNFCDSVSIFRSFLYAIYARKFLFWMNMSSTLRVTDNWDWLSWSTRWRQATVTRAAAASGDLIGANFTERLSYHQSARRARHYVVLALQKHLCTRSPTAHVITAAAAVRRHATANNRPCNRCENYGRGDSPSLTRYSADDSLSGWHGHHNHYLHQQPCPAAAQHRADSLDATCDMLATTWAGKPAGNSAN